MECHPYLPQIKLKEFCQSNCIFLTGYAPLGSPKRSWAEPGEDAILDEPIVKQIADKYKKTNAQILIKFQVIVLFKMINTILCFMIDCIHLLYNSSVLLCLDCMFECGKGDAQISIFIV